MNANATAASAARSFHSPYDRFLKPVAEKLLKKAQLSPGSLHGLRSQDAKGNASLAATFASFKSSPFVSATMTSDPSPVVASLSMDVNQDGKMDLVTVQNDGTVNVLLGSNNFAALVLNSQDQRNCSMTCTTSSPHKPT